MHRISLLTLFTVLVPCTLLFAQVPRTISYQGVLTDAEGAPLPNGPQTLTYRLYESETGGLPVWEESREVDLIDGVFSVYLGEEVALTLPFDRPYWLGVSIGDGPELAPRTPLTSAPYSLSAAGDASAWTVSGSDVYRTEGNVGIGTTNPVEQLEITGNLRLPATTAGSGVMYAGEDRFLHAFGAQNVFVGLNAGNLTTVGRENAALGFAALQSVDIGSFNTATGASALRNNTTGRDNTANGALTLTSNTTGGRNTAAGANALRFNTVGEDNTAVGIWTLANNTTGGSNTATGASALRDNATGGGNTAHGALALSSNSTGTSNTAVGANALLNTSTGSRNTALGADTDVTSNNLMNATAIGYGAVVNASNKVRIGNGSVTVIEGQVPFTSVSDRGQKENFMPVDKDQVLEKIREIPVESWNYVGQDPSKFRHYGPVAQDFFAAFGHDGVGAVGTPRTLSSGDVQGILMIAVQALERKAAEQHDTIERLQEQITVLKARLDAVQELKPGERVVERH